MRKIFAHFLLSCILLSQLSTGVLAKEKIPDLPDLPPEFDTVLPPDGVDVFSPSTTPAQVAPEKPSVTQPSTTQNQTVTKPVQTTSSQKTTVQTPPEKTTSTQTKKPAQTVQKVNT